jgi:hypothetical protein
MSVQLTLLPQNVDGTANNFINAIASLAFSGNYATGGDTLDFTQIMALLGTAIVAAFVDSAGDASSFGAGLGGYFTLIPGATLATWKILCWSAGGAQLAAGAYPASLLASGAHENALMQITARKLL